MGFMSTGMGISLLLTNRNRVLLSPLVFMGFMSTGMGMSLLLTTCNKVFSVRGYNFLSTLSMQKYYEYVELSPSKDYFMRPYCGQVSYGYWDWIVNNPEENVKFDAINSKS